MSVDIRVQSVTPLRQTFAHIARRFGDRPASRYQEATYDLQSEVNHHYKPLWDPDREVYDRRRTAVQMADWYALKDPRQYYYGSWTIARSRQQETADRQLEYAQRRAIFSALSADQRDAVIRALLPLRHYEWGANTNLCFVSAYGYGTALTQAAAMATIDRLGMAQHVSRIGLLLDGGTGQSLREAKRHWLDDAIWQGVRREVENLFAMRDWFEVLVNQALVADGLMLPLVLRGLEPVWGREQGPALATLVDFPLRWHEEYSRWADAVIKVAVAESESNRALIQGWLDRGRQAWTAALRILVTGLGDGNGNGNGEGGEALVALADQALDERLRRLGLSDHAAH